MKFCIPRVSLHWAFKPNDNETLDSSSDVKLLTSEASPLLNPPAREVCEWSSSVSSVSSTRCARPVVKAQNSWNYLEQKSKWKCLMHGTYKYSYFIVKTVLLDSRALSILPSATRKCREKINFSVEGKTNKNFIVINDNPTKHISTGC